MLAPDLLHAEIVNVFVQAVGRGRLPKAEAMTAVQDLLTNGIHLHPSALHPSAPLAL